MTISEIDNPNVITTAIKLLANDFQSLTPLNPNTLIKKETIDRISTIFSGWTFNEFIKKLNTFEKLVARNNPKQRNDAINE
jgi:hypothetical protein